MAATFRPLSSSASAADAPPPAPSPRPAAPQARSAPSGTTTSSPSVPVGSRAVVTATRLPAMVTSARCQPPVRLDLRFPAPFPKSVYAAKSHVKVAAALSGQPASEPSYVNTCYSIIAPNYGISVAGVHQFKDGKIVDAPGARGSVTGERLAPHPGHRGPVRPGVVPQHHGGYVHLMPTAALGASSEVPSETVPQTEESDDFGRTKDRPPTRAMSGSARPRSGRVTNPCAPLRTGHWRYSHC